MAIWLFYKKEVTHYSHVNEIVGQKKLYDVEFNRIKTIHGEVLGVSDLCEEDLSTKRGRSTTAS
jgi:hypothetical protein